MLNSILPDITRLCRIMSTVTGVDIEIVNADMTRVAGTGIYADSVGKSLEQADAIYHTAFTGGKTVFVDNPRDNELCHGCPDKARCRELLNMCSPIMLNGRTLGVIGVVCFSREERERVMAQKEVFLEFVEQIASVIARRVDQEQQARKVSRMLDALMQVTDGNARGVLILGRSGKISYINEMACQSFALPENCQGMPVALRDTGNVFANMAEYEVRVNGVDHLVFGRHMPIQSQDEDFASVLITDPLERLTEMLSQAASSGESSGALDAIISEGKKLGKLKDRVRQIAKTPSTVLITGESGTGKELFARAIHAESDRADKPFIAINCGAIPDQLLESELFGYVRGAFTGASDSGRMGKFELANKGVIFLDEISSMSLYLQVKLLRVLQEKCFTRLGSNRLIEVDVRVIAATNDNLAELIAQRMFREDLFYRLNVIPLELPPLRERKEDIPRLAEYFLDRYCTRFGKPPVRLSPHILETFQAYPWPGNVREFENCIEYMINMHEGGPMSHSLVPLKIRTGRAGGAPAPAVAPREALSPAAPAGPEHGEAPIAALADLETAAIRNAIARYGTTAAGKQQAARALGIGIATLYRKLRDIPGL
ncbi:PAS modulated sigma54 specific transcriptional regulator, Fis family [uncultured delta proteobacterium]|uniref:PAS modulated sigma54 specific transcriptional regulator, Fis family n=1 Tax=uncultured delta proteobacterium TaxID=34034 RepID=A0A212JBI3_9DELT|nr:PAS modulated sigma54 specific transcriptional regulator, Fis family [uncultured delta proteobacterium]